MADSQAEDSIGMAMTFTIASAVREILRTVISERARKEQEEEDRKAAEYEEVCITPSIPVSSPSAFFVSSSLIPLRWKRDGREVLL